MQYLSIKLIITSHQIQILMKQISSILSIVLALSLAITVLSKPFTSSKVVIALNCGSKTQQVNSPQGFKYVPDSQYVKGQSVDVDYHNDKGAVDADIKFALDKDIYMYQRHTYGEMTYELPIRKGLNTIVLKFAQMYFQNRGQRVFNIKIGSKIVLENFDVIEKSGAKYAAHEEYIEVEVRTDGVYYAGSKIPQGLENNKLKLSFSKGKADNPIVQAIIVYQDSVANSPKAEFELLKNKWSSQQQMNKAKKEEKELKELIAIQKKKERVVIRNDQLLIEEEQQVKSNAVQGQKFSLWRRILMSWLGVAFWGVLMAYVLGFLYKYVFMMGDVPLPMLKKE